MKVYLSLIVALVLFVSCTKDKFEGAVINVEFCDSLAPTYDSHVKAIIDASCAVSGCHTANFSSGDFTSFGTLETYINDGKLENRVVTVKDMPPSWSQIDTLTTKEFEIINCWFNNGSPQN